MKNIPPLPALARANPLRTLLSCLAGLIPLLSAQELPTDGLMARWDFEEGAGAVAHDTSGQGNDGTLDNYVDDSQWVAGRFGGGLAFTGLNSNRLIVPDAPSISADLANTFTVSAWFKSNGALAAGGSGAGILEKGNSYFLLQGVASGGMNLLLKKGGANITVPLGESLLANTWYNVAGVFDGTAARLYLNGELKGTLPVTAPIDTTDLALVIGGDDAGRTFNGVIDQVALWNRALTGEELLQVAARVGAPKIEQPPQSLTLYAGGTATFTVNATGADPLRYLWYRGTEPLRTQTAATLVLPYATAGDAGEYSVEVSNDVGTVRSAAASLAVQPVTGLATARVLHLPFDETSGLTAADASGQGNNGTLSGFVDNTSHWVPGQVNGSIRYELDEVNNVGSAIGIADSPSLDGVTGEATFAFWMKPAGWGFADNAGSFFRSATYVLRKGNHFGIRVLRDPGSVLETIVARSGPGTDNGAVPRNAFEAAAPQGTVALDQWQHWVVLYRNGTITFYQNGFRVSEPVAGTLGIPDESSLAVGAYDDSLTAVPSSAFDGGLDEISVWARPLSEAEILELAGKDVTGAPVVARQPASQKRIEGTTAVFEVFVTGKRPVEYQWLKNGNPISGATSSRLVVERLQPSDAGPYSVRVTNSQGSTVSDAATLTIEALDAITSGLVAYYDFDEGAGTTLTDRSGNGLHGTLKAMEASAWVDGPIGRAIRFDGVDDYIEVAHHALLNMTTELTVSVWINVYGLSSANYDRVLRKDTNFDLSLLPNGVARTHGVGKTPYDSPAQSWETGVWAHFAYVFKNGTVQWFKNGEPIGNPIRATIGELSTKPLVIGNYQAPPGTINRPFLGTIDDLGIWQRALSPGDILGIFVNGTQGKPLDEEFEPLSIQNIRATAGMIEIAYYSPFNNRPTQIERKTAPADAAWTVVDNATIADLGQGNFRATLPAGPAAASFFQVAVLPPPPLFFDDFETALPGWTHGGNEDKWQRGVPTTGPGAAFSPSQVYATGLGENLGAYTDAWLRTPEIDLTSVGSATLTFAEWLNLDFLPGVPAGSQIHQATINVLDAATLAPIQTAIYLGTGSSNGWQVRRVRLVGDAVGRKVRIEFRVFTDAFNLLEGWFLDDVTVTAN